MRGFLAGAAVAGYSSWFILAMGAGIFNRGEEP